MKCEKCPKQATLHITEVQDPCEEHHLCEQCAHEYLYESQPKKPGETGNVESDSEVAALNQRQCPHCGLTFVEFRNTGRLGCPHDYDLFAEELTPLLENIHGDRKHAGKSPRRQPQPQPRSSQNDLTRLRRQLQTAVTSEAYEEAARLRDQIRQIEEA
jgi:protein arginine kinase activator